MSGIMKDSGIEWIGEIPERWEVWRLKHLAKNPLQYGANEIGEDFSQAFPRYIRITDISSNNELKDENKLSLSPEIASEFLLDEGDILFARSGATVGKTFYYKKEYGSSCFAGYLIRFTANENIMTGKFVYYYTLSNAYSEWINMIFIQATIQNINAEKYANLHIPVPKMNEQCRIINYLDQKCADIDKVITAKKNQNELLKEQRQSIIYEAVTKGLDKNVKYKDSGIEWIGKIPEDWDVSKIKYITNLKSGESITAQLIEMENLYIPIPSQNTEIQKTIADYLEQKCSDIDRIIISNNDMIIKLKEYRQSVIYEAVTGKIEVRWSE